jgi:hypothetical protein
MARTNVVKFPPSYKRLRKKRAKDAPYTGFKPVTRQSQKGQDAVEAIIFSGSVIEGRIIIQLKK